MGATGTPVDGGGAVGLPVDGSTSTPLTWAERYREAQLAYDKLIGQNIEEYDLEGQRARRRKLSELQHQLEWLQQKAAEEGARANGGARYNSMYNLGTD